MGKEVRVRYAPSPTGLPHVGNIRTALFNWLFARHYGGKFIVRIEDTDRARYVDTATEAMLDGLRWLGIDWDEGPQVGGLYASYFQSERLPLYQQAASKLVSEGKAYYCYCTPERLDKMRETQIAAKTPPGYDRTCRSLSDAQRAALEKQSLPCVVRFKCPSNGKTVFNDAIRGQVEFENALLDDFIILKSDGYPTYHLANVVDDAAMHISHVLRAEEWIPSTPKHILLYEALDLKDHVPIFAHMPMILGPDKSKLSKRHGAIAITAYKEEGYLPESMFNFLALLGWAYDDKTEIFDCQELIKYFDLNKVSKTAAIFNVDKLNWMNGMYIRSLEPTDLAARMQPLVEEHIKKLTIQDVQYLQDITPLIQERIKLLNKENVVEPIRFFFTDKLEYSTDNLKASKLEKEPTQKVISTVKERLQTLNEFSDKNLEIIIKPLLEQSSLKPGQFYGALRWAVSASEVSPPIYSTMRVLGKERVINRMQDALAALKTF
ncbi:MAG: glutamate--tRNA ligase [Chloroflexi bacterium]|nr:glutamate--tRNA ligase [Chloroflexota bacterium]